MDTKLTLKLDSSIIENAKVYAKSKNTSVSRLIETYLELLISPNDEGEITPLVKSLSGIIKLSSDYDYKKDYRKHLTDKYNK